MRISKLLHRPRIERSCLPRVPWIFRSGDATCLIGRPGAEMTDERCSNAQRGHVESSDNWSGGDHCRGDASETAHGPGTSMSMPQQPRGGLAHYLSQDAPQG